MPANKKQHYVPKFYLKRFSNAGPGISIGIFNIPAKRYITTGCIKNEAYREYFYGTRENNVEEAFAKLENRAARLFSDLVENNKPLIIGTPVHRLLLNFLLLTRFRTLYAAEEQEEMLNKSLKKIYAHDECISPYLNSIHINYDNPVIEALRDAVISIPLSFDLAAKLIFNKSGCPLITSDNPVVFYNQFFEKRGIKAFSGTGIASKGLQIFFPLDSDHVLLVYDRDVYKVASARKEYAIFNSIEDAIFLNKLQVFNSRENVYFNSRVGESDIRELIMSCEMRERKEKVNIEEFMKSENNSGISSSIIHFRKKDIQINLTLSFIKIHKKAKEYDFGNSVFHVRDPEIVRLHYEFVKLAMAGKYKSSEFGKFLATKMK